MKEKISTKNNDINIANKLVLTIVGFFHCTTTTNYKSKLENYLLSSNTTFSIFPDDYTVRYTYLLSAYSKYCSVVSNYTYAIILRQYITSIFKVINMIWTFY